MKRAKLLISALMLLTITAMAQPSLYWRFANQTTYTIGADCYMQFDVQLAASAPATYHSSMMVYFDYNPAVFGNTIVANNAITYTSLALMSGEIGPGTNKYNYVNHADNTATRYAITTEALTTFGMPNFMNEVPVYPAYAGFIQFTIKVANPGLAGIAFTPDTGAPLFVGLMNGNQFYCAAFSGVEVPYGPLPNYAGTYENDLLTYDVSCGPVVVDYVWNGSVDSDWFNLLNWTPNGVPTAVDNATVPVTMNDPALGLGGIGYVNNLTIDPNAALDIMYTDALEAGGLVTNNGTISVYADAMTGAIGSFIDGGMAGNGAFYMERPIVSYVPNMPNCQDNSPMGWHYISSPLAGIDYQSVPMGDYWMNEWVEGTSMFQNFAPGAGPNVAPPCIVIGAVNTWGSGVGYSLRWCSADSAAACQFATGTVIEFAGTNAAVHTGDVTVPMTASGGAFDGWNLVGNPYPSTWDYETFYAENFGTMLVDDAIYFWDDVSLQYAAWVFGSGVNGGSRYVQPGQGFFWHTPVNTAVTFTNTQRVSAVAPYWKNNDNQLNLKVSGNGYNDETVIRFIDNATVGFDGDFDAYKLLSVDFVPSLYTGSGEEILSINSQPATELVHMSFQTSVSGAYTIEAIETGAFANVVLEDLVTGVQTNLLTDSYTFNYTAGENAARFIVHFTPLGSPELEANSIQIYANQSNITINVPANVTGEVVVYNVVGQEIAKANVVGGENTLTVSDVNTVYIVKVTANNSVVTEKVYIK